MAQLNFGLNINEDRQKNGYDFYEQNLSSTLKAVAEENWNFNPLQMTRNYFDLVKAKQIEISKNNEPVPRDELNKKYSDLGLFFENDEFQSVVDIMVDEKKEERDRQSIISRGPKGSWNPFKSGFYVGAAKVGTGLAVSLADPFNVALSFVPVVGQSKFAYLAARTSLRTARLTKGAVEGAVGATILEPIVYNVAQKLQADYTLTDSLLNITFGTVIGGGLHVGIGKLKDMNTAKKFNSRLNKIRKDKEDGKFGPDQPDPELNLYREYYPVEGETMMALAKTDPKTRRLLLEKSVRDIVTEEGVDASPVVNSDPTLKKVSETVTQPPQNIPTKTKINQTTEANDVATKVPRNQNTINNPEIESIEKRLETQKQRQTQKYGKDLEFGDDPKAKITEIAKNELDEVNTKSKDLQEAVSDYINCTSGR